MARVHFTSHLTKHVPCPAREAAGATLREVLDAALADDPRLAGYVLDDQRRLRQHVMAFIDDAIARDREQMSDPVRPESEIYIMQALSGG